MRNALSRRNLPAAWEVGRVAEGGAEGLDRAEDHGDQVRCRGPSLSPRRL